jgi:AraC family transcriptional regulator of adaptative response/methylated-DNA-[protein]-cysteine methyltransferase
MTALDAPANNDYEIVRRVIETISENWRDQPDLTTLASEVGKNPIALQKLFKRWAGLTPKDFLQAVTIDHAKRLLDAGTSLLDASLELGLSGPGRLHDLFVTHEAMSPGVYKSGGEGLEVTYGFHPSPFGTALLMMTDKGLAGLAFCDAGQDAEALEDMQGRWPRANYHRDDKQIAATAKRVFDPGEWHPDRPLRVVMIGTDFEIRVWEGLLSIPLGDLQTYSGLGERVGANAPRAIGRAVGRNPLSFVVPCHRVVGKSGALTGYHWGLTRKRAMLGWEAGMSAAT